MESPSSTTGDLRQELRGDAQTVTDTAKERLHSEVDSRKGEAVGQAKTLSSALEDAAGKLDPNTPNWLRSALQQGARTIQQLADSVEQKDSRQLSRDVQQLARQNPGTFLAGCALVGFAAARVLRAGTSAAAETGTGYTSGSATTSYPSSGSSYPSSGSSTPSYPSAPTTPAYSSGSYASGGYQPQDAGQGSSTGSATPGFSSQPIQPVT